ncbi:MAG: SufE family protein [Gammaproteobacteria bacterium]|nr:MAG: SufE family protein [Gammaproteobacteria bacterium]
MAAGLMNLADIKETFGFFDSWEDKYRFVIDLGKELPDLADTHKISENLIRGCQSQVWLVASYDKTQQQLELAIDSDAHIVRGLISIVLAAYNRQSPDYISQFDIEALFEELALIQHLSLTRGNGLRAMVARIQQLAASIGEANL